MLLLESLQMGRQELGITVPGGIGRDIHDDGRRDEA